MDAEKMSVSGIDSWDVVLLTLGGTPITLSAVILFVLALLALPVLARLMQRWIVDRLLARTHLDRGARDAIGTLVRYSVIIIGLVVVMQNAGVNLAAFSVLAGAVGVGIGFGLQNVFSNFFSGLIIMIERPVKIGDRIEVAGFEGDVVQVGARSTTLQTARRARVIVPNQKIITEVVRNWDADDDLSSLQLTLKVPTAHDPAVVRELLRTTAIASTEVERSPEPVVELLSLDAAGASFQLLVWTRGDAERRSALQSALYFSLFEKLSQQGVKLV